MYDVDRDVNSGLQYYCKSTSGIWRALCLKELIILKSVYCACTHTRDILSIQSLQSTIVLSFCICLLCPIYYSRKYDRGILFSAHSRQFPWGFGLLYWHAISSHSPIQDSSTNCKAINSSAWGLLSRLLMKSWHAGWQGPLWAAASWYCQESCGHLDPQRACEACLCVQSMEYSSPEGLDQCWYWPWICHSLAISTCPCIRQQAWDT